MTRHRIFPLAVIFLVVAVFVGGFLGSGGLHQNQAIAALPTSGNGIPVSATVVTTTGGTSILNANPLRRALRCQNIGTTNPAYITFGQTPTATNGFYLSPGAASTPVVSSSMINFPAADCGTACVPLGAVNAIATGSSTTVVCWEQ